MKAKVLLTTMFLLIAGTVQNLMAQTASQVWNISNDIGALMYNPNSKFVWVSGKDGATFSASDANCQWVIYPTGTIDEYYLYNVGAGKFAIPSGPDSGASWIFSPSAVAVKFNSNGDAYDIQTASGNLYISVDSESAGPIVSSRTAETQFTRTEVSGASTGNAATAVGKLLTANSSKATANFARNSDGWYAIRIKGASQADYTDYFLFPKETNYHNETYPLGFYDAVRVRPSISDATYLFHITGNSNNSNLHLPSLQLSDGRYLYSPNEGTDNVHTPCATFTETTIRLAYQNQGFHSWVNDKSNTGWFATPTLINGQYFISEVKLANDSYFDIYPVNLTNAGLVAWEIRGSNNPEGATVTCTRNDVSGLNTVYVGGYIFLPTGVTPTNSDFTAEGSTNISVTNSNYNGKYVTVTYSAESGQIITKEDVVVAQGWQTAGCGGEVKLMQVSYSVNDLPNSTILTRIGTSRPVSNVRMTVNLKEGTEDRISGLTLYEASSNSPEILGSGLTKVSDATISGSTATFAISNYTSTGSHYYWIAANVKGDATPGSVLDAAVTGISYTFRNNDYSLDLTDIGDPADNGATVFNVQSYPFLPNDNSSKYYRSPAMVVANDGSIVVASDKRYSDYNAISGHTMDIVVRRSTDGGQSWSNVTTIAKGRTANNKTYGYASPTLIKGNDGKIYCIYVYGSSFVVDKVCVSVSTDNGATWDTTDASPADLGAQEKLFNDANLYNYYTSSGRGICTTEGYLMAILKGHTSGNSDCCYIIYSADEGATWHIAATPIYTNCGDGKLVQLNDGSLLVSSSKTGYHGFNTATYTDNGDGTLTFAMGTQQTNSQLQTGEATNQDILSYSEYAEGDNDILIQSMNTGIKSHLKLYISIDGGQNWEEMFEIQPKGVCNVTMDKLQNGDVAILFEDQALNAEAGATDYNHYPLNYITIAHEKIMEFVTSLSEAANLDGIKVVYGTTGEDTYGAWEDLTWTSNATSGRKGLKLTVSGGSHSNLPDWNGRYNLAFKVARAGATGAITLTAPTGFIIEGYTLEARNHMGGTSTIKAADGTTINTTFDSYKKLSVKGLTEQSTSISVTNSSTDWLGIANFTVRLLRVGTIVGDVDRSGTVDSEDLNMLISVLLGTTDAEDYDEVAADANEDGILGIGDVTALVNILLEEQQ